MGFPVHYQDKQAEPRFSEGQKTIPFSLGPKRNVTNQQPSKPLTSEAAIHLVSCKQKPQRDEQQILADLLHVYMAWKGLGSSPEDSQVPELVGNLLAGFLRKGSPTPSLWSGRDGCRVGRRQIVDRPLIGLRKGYGVPD